MDVFFAYADLLLLVFLVFFFFGAGVQFARFFMRQAIKERVESDLAPRIAKIRDIEEKRKEAIQAKKEANQAKSELDQLRLKLEREVQEEKKRLINEFNAQKKLAMNQQKRYARQSKNVLQIAQKAIEKAEWERAERNAYLPYEDRR